MFLAGLVAAIGSFVGFLRTGGGEQVLQQALVSFLPHGTGGQAKFDRLELDVQNSRLMVYKIWHSPIGDGQNVVSGLQADVCEIGLDLWPRPDITRVVVRGMRDLKLEVQKGFLQKKRAYPPGPPFPIVFEDVNCVLQLGGGPALKLDGCRGEIRAAAAVAEPGRRGELIGDFSLQRLNDKPFRFRLATLADGRWEFRGVDLVVDTRPLAGGERPVITGQSLDPIELLLRSLLTGESGARGTVSLQGVVQPAAEGRPFACEGRIGYRNLVLRLPSAEVQSGVLPMFLEWMLEGRKASWPRLLMADTIATGPDGQVAFHMVGQRLEFACDEGPGSALIAGRDGANLAPLESLKGSVLTDADYHPREIVLRGFLGDALRGEALMRRGAEGQGVYEVLIEPRAAGPESRQLGVPLWRFHSILEDRGKLVQADRPDDDLLRFSLELSAMNFVDSFKLLPPGFRDLSGRWHATGRLAADRRLILSDISWTDGTLIFGGPDPADPFPFVRRAYGPVMEALKPLWGGGPAWRLQNVSLRGQAEAEYNERGEWLRTRLVDWRLASGDVTYDGKSTDYGALDLSVRGEYGRSPEHPDQSEFTFQASPRTEGDAAPDWWMRLVGILDDNGSGLVWWKEYRVPLKIHPERDRIDKRFVRGTFTQRVYRQRTLKMEHGRPKDIEETVLPE